MWVVNSHWSARGNNDVPAACASKASDTAPAVGSDADEVDLVAVLGHVWVRMTRVASNGGNNVEDRLARRDRHETRVEVQRALTSNEQRDPLSAGGGQVARRDRHARLREGRSAYDKHEHRESGESLHRTLLHRNHGIGSKVVVMQDGSTHVSNEHAAHPPSKRWRASCAPLGAPLKATDTSPFASPNASLLTELAGSRKRTP
jgi:hypothetical protein